MGFFDKLFRRQQKVNVFIPVADTLSGTYPSYSGYNRITNIWQCDLAWQCLDRITKEIAKIVPAHVIRTPDMLQSVNDNIQRVLCRPNEVMTTYDAVSKILYALYTRGDAFIIPIYEGSRLYGLYPVIPVGGVDWLDNNGELWVKLKFANNKEYLYPYFAVIHLRLNYGEDDYMGTVREGPLLYNMQMNQDLLESVKKGVSSSYAVNGIVKYGTALSKSALEKDVKEFSAALKRNESGLLGLDNQADFREIKRDIKLIDADTLQYVSGQILNHFGVSQKILDGTASKEEEESWFHATIQPIMESMGQAFSRVLFTETQLNKGHCIRWYAKDRLHWMTGSELTETVKQLTQVGGISVNEMRDAFGFAPLEGEEGNIRPMSLNFIDSRYATEYQLNSAKNGGKKNEGKTQDE